ncbi:hypothetical protein Acsp04_42400 [Actinomadura sp. NBRC 104425]|uniref:hypothetical protein n=1 Tax=Actinomadura sp. NBRC 104425 TaxID=3032204 RepID=UPI0024A49C3A|nr:hypothetical protein [Actinomadura sp. NBRC 104425]GLZ14005.1 hypothetical protein Acsp04_42400 [Actinomadura sp. NBRC 104425]
MSHITLVRRAFPLLVAVLAAAGCSSSSDRPAADKSATATPLLPLPHPELTGADDADVKACKDADCEIVVRGRSTAIPLDQKFGITTFLLTHVPPDKVTYVVIRTNGESTQAFQRGTGRFSLDAGLTVTVRKIDHTGAVVRFEPKARDGDKDRITGSRGAAIYN